MKVLAFLKQTMCVSISLVYDFSSIKMKDTGGIFWDLEIHEITRFD